MLTSAGVDEWLRPQNPAAESGKRGTLPSGKKFAELWANRLRNAMVKHRSWREEAQTYYGLYYNHAKAWSKMVTIKGYNQPLVVFTNPVALNVDADRDRLLPKDPEFDVYPKSKYVFFDQPDAQTGEMGKVKRDNVQAARMYQQTANILASELDLRRIIRREATDALVTNLGVVKIAWDEIGDLAHGSAHVEDDSGRVVGGYSGGDEVSPPKYPWVVQVPWDRIILDPTAGNFEQVNWIAEEILVPKRDADGVKGEGDEITDIKNVDAAYETGDESEYEVRSEDTVSLDIKFERKYEIHYRTVDRSRAGGFRYCTFDLYLSGGGVVRNHREYTCDLGGFCYEFLQFKEIVGDLLGYSQVRLYASPAAHDNLSKQITLDYAMRTLPFAIASQSIGKQAIDAITAGKVGKLVVSSGPAEKMVMPVQMSPINAEMLAVAQMSRQASDEMSGRSLNDRLQGGVSTATEAKVIDRNSGQLMGAQADVIRVHVARVMRKAMRVFAYLLGGDKFEIPNGKGGFLEVYQQNLACDITLETAWQSAVRQDDAVERKLNMDLLNILVSAKSSGMVPNVNLTPVLEKILVSSGYDDPQEVLVPEEVNMSEPAHEHMVMLAGTDLMPAPDEDLQKNYQEHLEFLGLVNGADPELTALWASIPGAIQRLTNHVEATADAMVLAGLMPAEQAGAAKPGMGSGAHNRPSQGIPNEGDMMAAQSRATNVGGGGPGRMAGV